MNIAEIVEAAQEVIALIDEYHNQPDREMLVDPILYAYLSGSHGRMSRQMHVPIYGSVKPKRIDFRHGGSSPVVLEFAVRPPTGGGHLYGSQNSPELRKLCRVSRSRAALRALLLVDLYHDSLDLDRLRLTYEQQGSGPGNFERHSVRVIYVSRTTTFSFLWRP